ncbi:hypothetical protein DDE18_02175 [Nocardioides gansuensis]|uniref:DUF4386 domain-containing protein n=1 Tax=Nocardioides gansuensis TaxID=2138300 RepID=A0A2T8FFE7_9ACTN|nr:hypothetical protein [Nocardioides gansuensis]PVG84441.1 hypothetical protein DDE18_02175 [Nocardioides gansuensis]
MRAEWVSGSAAALVFGALSLLLGFSLSPLPQDQTVSKSVLAASDVPGQWLFSALMLFVAAIGLTLGTVALLTLLRAGDHRNRRLAVLAISLYTIGTIGMAGYAMVLVLLRALVLNDVLVLEGFDRVMEDPGFRGLSAIWLGGFLLGLALLAIGMLRTDTAGRWVPALLLAFVASQLMPLPGANVTTVLQFVVLAVALTGAGLAANDLTEERRGALATG